MFRILHDTHFEFMKYRRFWIILSTAINLVALGLIFIRPASTAWTSPAAPR
jgi:hypothetical protein